MDFVLLDNQSQVRHTDWLDNVMLDHQHRALHWHTVDQLQPRTPRHIKLTVLPQRGDPHAPPQPMDRPWMACMGGLLPVHMQPMRQAQR